ncbi:MULTISPECIES: metallophosphoesterase [Bacillus amyloliquefaciens group]|uniref:metallophosphoesterase n=1 Tax=Bacillus amyloliquefaciens group TaxID=1938374 RepID=UPI00073BCCB2|nr:MULTISPECIES: metallophosphoesterase [Bacillus amyloliquefaciens group]KTF59763.1 hypothetical protein AR691_13600 [Bacillus amyloliquefaciens]
MKILMVGDLHLYTNEIRTTKKMVKNNEVMLKNLYKYLKENEDIDLVIFGGDLQHQTPKGDVLREVSLWRKWFRKIGKLMAPRRKRIKNFKIHGVSEKVKKGFDKGRIYPLISVRGNHDDDKVLKVTAENKDDYIKQYTFFDELVDEDLILNPKGLTFTAGDDKFYIDIRNYGEADRSVPKGAKNRKVIAVFHDNVLQPESPLWMIKGKSKEGVYNAEDVMVNVDIGILNHIHERVDPLYIEASDGVKVLWQIGSMGRTSLKDENMRDVGYCGLIDTDNLDSFGTVEIDVIPAEEYFSFQKAFDAKKRKSDYEDFELKMNTVNRKFQDPREDIKALEDVDDRVKQVCVDTLTEIMDRKN